MILGAAIGAIGMLAVIAVLAGTFWVGFRMGCHTPPRFPGLPQ